MVSTMLYTLADRTLLLMLENKFEDTKGVSETINRRTDNTMAKRRRTDNAMAKRRRTDKTMAKRRTDNTMAKRKKIQSRSTKHYTEN